MLSGWLRSARVHLETLRQYQAAVITAEALVWHHGYKGLDAALTAAERPTGHLRQDVRAELVARFAADRYLQVKQADVVQRAALLDLWSRRRGQMIYQADAPFVKTASAG